VTHPYADIPLVLLSGVGRSGTTALREALGRHPLVHSTGSENNIIYDVIDAARRNCVSQSRRHAMRVDEPTYNGLFRELILKLLWPEPRGTPPQRLLAFSALTPCRADYLCRVFPGARIVYLVRDGIEVVASRMLYPSFSQLPFEWQCEVWAESADIVEWAGGRDNLTVLRHEHLHGDQALAALWPFLGLDPEPGCLDHLRGIRHHPTLPHRGDRWRDWTEQQRDVFVEICGNAMRCFDYAIPWLSVEPVHG
jgi:hypothetical protein